VRYRWPPRNGHKTYAMRANGTSPLRLRIILHRAATRLSDFQRFKALAEAQCILQNRRGDLQKPLSCNWALEFWFRGKM